jgi:hypothetical protein|nr:MAG TPA: hypothetical protein [Caudoviricetes sp.]
MQDVVITLVGEGGSYRLIGACSSIEVVRAEDGKASDVTVKLQDVPRAIGQQSTGGAYHTVRIEHPVLPISADVVNVAWDVTAGELTVSGGEDAATWNTLRVALSFPSSTPVQQVAQTVAAAAGLPVIGADSAVLPTCPRTFSCLWRDAMRQTFGRKWAVTASGVVCGGEAAAVTINDRTAYGVTQVRRERLDDGSVVVKATVVLPLTPCDVGAKVSGLVGEIGVAGRVTKVTHVITWHESLTTIEVERE